MPAIKTTAQFFKEQRSKSNTQLLASKEGQAAQADFIVRTQARLDNFAKTRGYDGILSLCTYAGSSVPKYKTEGEYGMTARDVTWGTLYTLLGNALAGDAVLPRTWAEVEALLPALEWPH